MHDALNSECLLALASRVSFYGLESLQPYFIKLLLSLILSELGFAWSDFLQVTVDLYQVTLVVGEVNYALCVLL